jgi:phosphinothricin acetyltransferase
MIRACCVADAARLAEIYNHYVERTIVTFEEAPIDAVEMQRRIATTTACWPWLVVEQDETVAGYAYASAWKSRSAYRFAVESTIYLAPGFHGRGLGGRLYRALVAELHERDVHCVIGGISLPNPASVALHERLGFAKIGEFREVGWKLGRWVDVGYWELIL